MKKIRLIIYESRLKISQTALVDQLGIHKNVLGVIPSIEIAHKIADILDVSLDFLVGKVDVEMDKTTHKRILEVSKFEDDDKMHIFSVIVHNVI